MYNPLEMKDIPPNSDDFNPMQLTKIFLGVVLGIFVLFMLVKINKNITTIIKQQGEGINLCRYG